MEIPLLADKTMQISRAFGVLDEEEGDAFRWASEKHEFLPNVS